YWFHVASFHGSVTPYTDTDAGAVDDSDSRYSTSCALSTTEPLGSAVSSWKLSRPRIDCVPSEPTRSSGSPPTNVSGEPLGMYVNDCGALGDASVSGSRAPTLVAV